MNKVIMKPQSKKIAKDKAKGKCETAGKGKPQDDEFIPAQISTGGREKPEKGPISYRVNM